MKDNTTIAASLEMSSKSTIRKEFFTLEFTGEEISWGDPAVVICRASDDWLELPLYEVPYLRDMLMGVLEEIKPFTDGEWFESHKQELLASSRMAWVDVFENYHLFMNAFRQKNKVEDTPKVAAPESSGMRIQLAKIELKVASGNDKTGLSVCFEGEEAQWGIPLVSIDRNAVGYIDCPLQDVHILIDLCNKILAETALFRDKEYFYNNIAELSRSPRASWVEHFDNYHRLMAGKMKASKVLAIVE